MFMIYVSVYKPL